MSFRSLLNGLCTVQSQSTSVNNIGEVVISFATGTQYPCRLDSLNQRGENEDLADRIATTRRKRLFLESTATITESDRVVTAGQTYNVLLVNTYDNSRKQHHKEVELEQVD